jgi:hypothetical protein
MKMTSLDLEAVQSDVPANSQPSELVRMVTAARDLFRMSTPMNWGDVALSEALSKLRPDFPPPACWKIVCAACVQIDESGEVDGMGVVHGDTEFEIVRSLAKLVEDKDIQIVTWNGRRYDVPVLEARCLHYGIPLPVFSRAWRYRYEDRAHYDVKDYLAGFGAAQSISMDQACKLVGLPGKPPDGTDGSKVAAMIAEGRLREVQAYCLSDAVQTAGIMLRTEVLRGRLTVEQGREACALLLAKAGADERVRWVAEGTDRKVFLMEESHA